MREAHHASFPIGNTQARPVLPAGQGPWAAPFRVRPAAAAAPAACMLLSEAAKGTHSMRWHVTQSARTMPAGPLLGCGDIRNALVTAAALRQLLHGAAPDDRATSETNNREEIQIHLNDVSDCILARDVLLLVRPAPTQPPRAINTWMRLAVAQHSEALLHSLLGRSLPPLSC